MQLIRLLTALTVFFAFHQLSPSGLASAADEVQPVLVEGVGLSSEEALKDAFREAVRQVVGSVVDAQTLLQNDELIDDEVLTYSGGFIKEYDKIDEKKDNGLIRIKISAKVERRSLVQKLRAANVTVKDIDGGGLFAEAMTQMEAEQDARQLLTNALDGFPLNCLTAEVVGKPEIISKDSDSATVRISTRVSVDLKAYNALAARIDQLLAKISLEKGEFATRSTQANWGSSELPRGWYFGERAEWRLKTWSRFIPSLRLDSDRSHSVIALNVQQSKGMTSGEWRYYVMDSSALQPFASSASCVFTVKLSLVDGEGGIVAVNRFPARTEKSRPGAEYHASAIFDGEQIGPYAGFYTGYGSNTQETGFFENYYKNLLKQHNLFVIAPVFFEASGNPCVYLPSLEFAKTFTMSLDELKGVQSIRCELQLDGNLPDE